MYLKRLEIQGFKTFANRTVIEFPTGVSAVVGPNGSGKSNVVDSIRWVLGEQSFAALRCKRTEDLVFSGGGRRAPLGMAEVTLTIDNSDQVLPLPFNEVTLTRRAFRSGENEYFINRSRVRLRDLVEATAPLSQSYTIVNQGLVDAALSLRPEERRGLFEDAASVSLANARRDEAERRLKESEQNLARLADLVAELEPRLRTLRRQAREAEQAGELQSELDGLLRAHYLRLWRAACAALAQAESAATASESELAASRLGLERCAEELRSGRAGIASERERAQQLASQVEVQSAAVARLEREIAVAAERSAALLRQEAELIERAADLTGQRDQSADALERGRESSALADRQLSESRTALAELEAQHAATAAARKQHEQALSAARQRAFDAEAAAVAARNRLSDLERRRVAVEQEQRTLDAEERSATERAAAAHAATAESEAALEQATAATAAAAAAEEQAQSALEALRDERARLERESAAARREADQLHSRLEALERTQRSYAGTFAGVRAALQWAERQGRQGFALVSTLLRVPAELETAIETALGSRLQQIVVERWADAEAAIAELKRSGAGRVTFLPLDTLRENRPTKLPALPGIIGVASELIDYDPHYEKIAAQLLGRTLVAEDLAAARSALGSIQGGWTIVTLAGEQVASSGAVTGGSQVKETGTLRRERELRELPQQLEQARAHLAQLAAADTAAAERERAAIQSRREAEARRRQSAQDEARVRELVQARRRAAERADQELTWHAGRRSAAERERAAFEAREQELRATFEQSEAQHAAAADVLSAASAALDQQLAEGRSAEAQLLQARTALAELEAQVRGHHRELALQQTRLSELEALLEEMQRRRQQQAADLAELRQQQAQREQELGVLTGRLAQLRAAQELLTQQLRAAQQLLAAQEEREQQLQAAALEAEAHHGRLLAAAEGTRVRRDQLWERCAEDGIDIEQLDASGLEVHDDGSVEQRIDQLRARLKRMGEVNHLAPAEYAETQERHSFLTTQIADARAASAALREVIVELQELVQARFAETFAAVAEAFSETFARLFGGGSASLELLEEGGVEITAQPPGKRRQPLSLLSGGERALTSAALLFALLNVRPTPFCILDEVDAALDEANVARFRELLLDLAQRTQVIVVTHNRGTVEAADTIYGISMSPDGSSRSISLRLEELSLSEG